MQNFLFSDLVSIFNIATVNPKKQKRGAHILRAHYCPSIRDEHFRLVWKGNDARVKYLGAVMLMLMPAENFSSRMEGQ